MKKAIAFTVFLIFIAVTLVACGGEATQEIQPTVNESEEEIRTVLKELYEAYMAGDESPIFEFMRNEEQKQGFRDMIDMNSFVWYSEAESLQKAGTLGIAFYDEGLLYIGEWENSRFNGEGKYFYGHNDVEKDYSLCTTLSGNFTDGAPNGICEEKYYVEDARLGPYVDTFKGMYINAVRDGEFSYTKEQEEEIYIYSGLTYKNGLAQKIGTAKYIGDYYAIVKDGGKTLYYVYDEAYPNGYSASKTSY